MRAIITKGWGRRGNQWFPYFSYFPYIFIVVYYNMSSINKNPNSIRLKPRPPSASRRTAKRPQARGRTLKTITRSASLRSLRSRSASSRSNSARSVSSIKAQDLTSYYDFDPKDYKSVIELHKRELKHLSTISQSTKTDLSDYINDLLENTPKNPDDLPEYLMNLTNAREQCYKTFHPYTKSIIKKKTTLCGLIDARIRTVKNFLKSQN